MKTLAIANGDLVLGAGGYQTVTGRAKIVQDLQGALGEDYGSDKYHPLWGSQLRNYIGGYDDPFVSFAIEQEVRRVLDNYIAVQAAEVARDMLVVDRSRFSTSDVVAGVGDITSAVDPNSPDVLWVNTVVTTMTGEQVAIQQAVS